MITKTVLVVVHCLGYIGCNDKKNDQVPTLSAFLVKAAGAPPSSILDYLRAP